MDIYINKERLTGCRQCRWRCVKADTTDRRSHLQLLFSASGNKLIAIVGPEFALWWTGEEDCWSFDIIACCGCCCGCCCCCCCWCGGGWPCDGVRFVVLECVECRVTDVAGDDGRDRAVIIGNEFEFIKLVHKNAIEEVFVEDACVWYIPHPRWEHLPDCVEFRPEFLVGLWYEADLLEGVGDLRLWFLVLL